MADPSAGNPHMAVTGEGRQATYIGLPHAAPGAEAFVPRGGFSGFGFAPNVDAWLWRIPDGRHYQVACFLCCMSVRNPGSLLL
jgi:hypothetical protein